MLKELRDALRFTHTDVVRIVGFALLSLLALIPMWDVSQVIFYFVGAMSIIALATHWFRKLLFPYIDLKEHSESALKDKNIASAIIVLAVALVICVLIFSASELIGFGRGQG